MLKKERLISFIKLILPTGVGIIIGAGLTRNKYVGWILLSYVIFALLVNLLISRMISLKDSVDKKIELKRMGAEGIGHAIEYIDFTFVSIFGLFDKYYPVYVFFLGIGSLIATFILLLYRQWFYSLCFFILMNFFMIQNQIWRKVKRCKI